MRRQKIRTADNTLHIYTRVSTAHQREGIELAKKAGKYKGRPPTIDQHAIRKLLEEGVPFRKVAERLGVSLSGVQRASKATAC